MQSIVFIEKQCPGNTEWARPVMVFTTPSSPLQLNSVTLEMREKAARVSELEWQVINRDTTIKVLQADRERKGVSALPSSVGGGASGSHDDPRATMLSPPASRIGGDTRWVWSDGCCGWGHEVGVV